MRLSHILENIDDDIPAFYETKDEIREWMRSTNTRGTIDKNLTISMSEDFSLSHVHLVDGYLPVSFSVSRSFNIMTRVKSLRGFPSAVLGDLNFMVSQPDLSNLEFFPQVIDKWAALKECTAIRSLEPLADVKIGNLIIPHGVHRGYLSLLKIRMRGNISYGSLSASNDELEALDIINKHRITGGDIIACQKELIKAGLREFANTR